MALPPLTPEQRAAALETAAAARNARAELQGRPKPSALNAGEASGRGRGGKEKGKEGRDDEGQKRGVDTKQRGGETIEEV